MTEPVHEIALQDVFQELIASGERPDAAMLEDFTRRYPQFAAEVTDFAVEWVLQDELPAETSDKNEATTPSAVPAAMHRFSERRKELAEDSTSTLPTAAADPFTNVSASQLGRIALRLRLDKTLLAKLRDRKIVADSIPDEIRKGLASELDVSIPVVIAHLTGPATIHRAASFKATGKPAAGTKESFAEAVRRSTLPDAEKSRWLSLTR